jgi:hypothetical protein
MSPEFVANIQARELAKVRGTTSLADLDARGIGFSVLSPLTVLDRSLRHGRAR